MVGEEQVPPTSSLATYLPHRPTTAIAYRLAISTSLEHFAKPLLIRSDDQERGPTCGIELVGRPPPIAGDGDRLLPLDPLGRSSSCRDSLCRSIATLWWRMGARSNEDKVCDPSWPTAFVHGLRAPRSDGSLRLKFMLVGTPTERKGVGAPITREAPTSFAYLRAPR